MHDRERAGGAGRGGGGGVRENKSNCYQKYSSPYRRDPSLYSMLPEDQSYRRWIQVARVSTSNRVNCGSRVRVAAT